MRNDKQLRSPFTLSTELYDLAQRALVRENGLRGGRWEVPLGTDHLLVTEEEVYNLRMYALTRHPRVDALIRSIDPNDHVAIACPTRPQAGGGLPNPWAPPAVVEGVGVTIAVHLMTLLQRAVGLGRPRPVVGHSGLSCLTFPEAI